MDGALTSYQKRLFVFLSVATFFEGYDFLALSQILPNLLPEMGIADERAGLVYAGVNCGTVLAFLLVRLADRIGRRRLLAITIAGYTLFTFATAFAPSLPAFVVLQLFARIFLIGEWVISMVIAAEEFPAARRGMVIGVIQACSGLGSVVCAGVVPLLLKLEVGGVAYGWRTVYFVGIVPLVILAFARRNLRETTRFATLEKRDRSLFAIWRTPYWKRVVMLSVIWLVSYIPSTNAIAYWKFFATRERGLDDGQAGLAISIAALVSMPFVFYAGRLLDRIGRRSGSMVIFGLGAIGIYGCFTFHGLTALTASLTISIFFANAYLAVLNAYGTELFPTEHRADAFAWSNNSIGRIAYVASPLVVASLSATHGFGPVVSATAVCCLAAVGLIFWLLPETKGRELEATSDLAS